MPVRHENELLNLINLTCWQEVSSATTRRGLDQECIVLLLSVCYGYHLSSFSHALSTLKSHFASRIFLQQSFAHSIGLEIVSSAIKGDASSCDVDM